MQFFDENLDNCWGRKVYKYQCYARANITFDPGKH